MECSLRSHYSFTRNSTHFVSKVPRSGDGGAAFGKGWRRIPRLFRVEARGEQIVGAQGLNRFCELLGSWRRRSSAGPTALANRRWSWRVSYGVLAALALFVHPQLNALR